MGYGTEINRYDEMGRLATVVDQNSHEINFAWNRTAFGEVKESNEFNFFTGKPEIEDLGYAFLFRNYQANTGKWQTSDPLGYPDGWNNLAYVNNGVTEAIDWLGREGCCSRSIGRVLLVT